MFIFVFLNICLQQNIKIIKQRELISNEEKDISEHRALSIQSLLNKK